MMKRLSTLFLSAAIVTVLFAPLLTIVNAQAVRTVDPIYTVGLFRPRLDGFLEPGLPGLISEWDHDSASKQIKLVAEDGTTLAGELKAKSIGTDFYFALDVETSSQPHVYIVFDLDSNGRGDQMVASIAGHSVDRIVRNGRWEPVDHNGTTIGLAAIAPSEEDNHWITEIGHTGLPDGTDVTQIGWNLLVVDTATWKYYTFPNPIPEPDCSFPKDPFIFPPIDPRCFQQQKFGYEIDPEPLVLLEPSTPIIRNIEVTQAIQTEDEEMPLVLGKTSLARVYVDPDVSLQEVTVTLYGSEIEPGELVAQTGEYQVWELPQVKEFLGSMTRTFVAPLNPERENIGDTANFLLPTDWTQVEFLGLFAEVTAVNGIEVLRDFVLIRGFQGSIFHFEETHDLVTYVLPVNDTTAPSIQTSATIQSWIGNMTNVYPMANPKFPILGSEFLGPFAGTNDELLQELTERVGVIQVLILLELLTGQQTHEFPDQIFGARWAGGGLSDPIWWACGESWASFGGPHGTSRELIMAHEIQHNIGPDDDTNGHYGRHIGGGGAEEGDPDWTSLYGDYEIHDLGWNPGVANPETNQQALVPADYPDFMSYLQNDDTAGVPDGTLPTKWISTYRWLKLFERLQNWEIGTPGLGSPCSDEVLQGVPTVRVVRGTIPINGTPSLDPTYETPGVLPSGYVPSTATDASFTTKIVIKDGEGAILQTIFIDPVFVDANGVPRDEYQFVYFVPDNGKISTVELVDDLDNVIQSYTSIDSPIVDFMSVPSSFQRRQEAVVSWSGFAPNSSFLQYQLEYSPDNSIWFRLGPSTFDNHTKVTFVGLPGSTEGRLRLRATNGLDTAYAVSSPFTLANQPPSIAISGSAPQQSVRSHFSFKASVSDPDMDQIAPDNIVWSLDDTELGRGLVVNFTIATTGKHVLKAEYTDPSGAMTEDSIDLDVINRPFPTIEALEEFMDALILEESPEDPLSALLWPVIILVILVTGAVITTWYLRRSPKDFN